MTALSSRTGQPRDRGVSLRSENALLAQIAVTVRHRRLAAGITQEVLAGLSGTGARFVRELEQAKPTLEIGKVLAVLQALGLRLALDVHRPLESSRNK
ncbi:MAG: helix-turn-helix transcriptional regulator [Xanthomonadales bacterium]|mgnify:CR=1 FL=1|nr:helix-turn-helix transcriptional regulator [Xanthomonadales bacterium]